MAKGEHVLHARRGEGKEDKTENGRGRKKGFRMGPELEPVAFRVIIDGDEGENLTNRGRRRTYISST